MYKLLLFSAVEFFSIETTNLVSRMFSRLNYKLLFNTINIKKEMVTFYSYNQMISVSVACFTSAVKYLSVIVWRFTSSLSIINDYYSYYNAIFLAYNSFFIFLHFSFNSVSVTV